MGFFKDIGNWAGEVAKDLTINPVKSIIGAGSKGIGSIAKDLGEGVGSAVRPLGSAAAEFLGRKMPTTAAVQPIVSAQPVIQTSKPFDFNKLIMPLVIGAVLIFILFFLFKKKKRK